MFWICICSNELTSLLLPVCFGKHSHCPFILFKVEARETFYGFNQKKNQCRPNCHMFNSWYCTSWHHTNVKYTVQGLYLCRHVQINPVCGSRVPVADGLTFPVWMIFVLLHDVWKSVHAHTLTSRWSRWIANNCPTLPALSYSEQNASNHFSEKLRPVEDQTHIPLTSEHVFILLLTQVARKWNSLFSRILLSTQIFFIIYHIVL